MTDMSDEEKTQAFLAHLLDEHNKKLLDQTKYGFSVVDEHGRRVDPTTISPDDLILPE